MNISTLYIKECSMLQIIEKEDEAHVTLKYEGKYRQIALRECLMEK